MFYHCVFVCLSVFLSARVLKKLWTDFDESFAGTGRGPRKNRWVFGGDPDHDPGSRNFLKDSLFTNAIPTDSQE